MELFLTGLRAAVAEGQSTQPCVTQPSSAWPER